MYYKVAVVGNASRTPNQTTCSLVKATVATIPGTPIILSSKEIGNGSAILN
jgi:hypothetical protein